MDIRMTMLLTSVQFPDGYTNTNKIASHTDLFMWVILAAIVIGYLINSIWEPNGSTNNDNKQKKDNSINTMSTNADITPNGAINNGDSSNDTRTSRTESNTSKGVDNNN